MQSNNINIFIEEKLKEFIKKNQLRKIFNIIRFKNNVIDINDKKKYHFLVMTIYLLVSIKK